MRLIIPINKETEINIGDVVVDNHGVQRPVLVKRIIKKRLKGAIPFKKTIYLLGHKNTFRVGKWKSHGELIELGDKLIYGKSKISN